MPKIIQSNAPTTTSPDSDVERLAREVADLRAENAANRAALEADLEAVRAQVVGQHGQLAPDTPPRQRDQSPKRRRGWGRGRSRLVSASEGEAMSRRRLLGLAGTAAAAGVGGALLAASPSEAVTGGNVIIDGSAVTNSGVATTFLTTDGSGGGFDTNTLHVKTTAPGGHAITGETNGAGTAVGGASSTGSGIAGNSGGGTGVFGQSSTGNSAQFVAPADGSVGAQLLLAPSGTAGAPTGTHVLGQFWVDSTGKLYQCVAAGNPGTWVSLSSPLVTLAPARVYDSRASQSPATGPKSPITNGSTVTVDVTGTQATPPGGPSGVPVGVSAVLGNVTLVAPSNGVFLTLYAAGAPQPSTSNINGLAGGVVANNFTSKLGSGGSLNKIAITCGGGPTDFIVDIFGYYP